MVNEQNLIKIPSDYIIVDGVVNPKYWFDPNRCPLNPFNKFRRPGREDD